MFSGCLNSMLIRLKVPFTNAPYQKVENIILRGVLEFMESCNPTQLGRLPYFICS